MFIKDRQFIIRVSCGRVLSIIYSDYVFVAVGIQQTMCLHHIFCGLPGSTLFSALSHKRHDFRKTRLLKIKCLFLFSLRGLSETLLTLRITRRDMTIDVYRFSCKVQSVLVRFQRDFKYRDKFSRSTQISNLMKIRLVGAEPFHPDRRTDRNDKANNRFLQFCESA